MILATLLNLLDSMSYGILIFPPSDTHLPSTAAQAGISMFLASSLISQTVFTMGGSKFKGALGSMMIEVMPFLHIICGIIEDEMKGAESPRIVATIVFFIFNIKMVAYAISAMITGLVFLLLGVFKLGNLIQFFPRHILIGCIGGIGLFLIFTGIEVTTDVTPVMSFQYIVDILQPRELKLWGSGFLCAVSLNVLQKFIKNPFLLPTFFMVLPVIFYAFVFATGVSLDQLRDMGWLFSLPPANESPFYIFWTYYDFTSVDWGAVFKTLPTQFALTFFGILHVPINGKL